MNLYLVVSEELRDYGNYSRPPEDYCIAELVVARNYSHAKWLARKTDPNSFYSTSFLDMPKFQMRLKRKNVEGPARVATPEYEENWERDKNSDLWDL